jgi:hypothetical protein
LNFTPEKMMALFPNTILDETVEGYMSDITDGAAAEDDESISANSLHSTLDGENERDDGGEDLDGSTVEEDASGDKPNSPHRRRHAVERGMRQAVVDMLLQRVSSLAQHRQHLVASHQILRGSLQNEIDRLTKELHARDEAEDRAWATEGGPERAGGGRASAGVAEAEQNELRARLEAGQLAYDELQAHVLEAQVGQQEAARQLVESTEAQIRTNDRIVARMEARIRSADKQAAAPAGISLF